MSKRLKITLPDPICEQLSDMAESSGEPISRVAAQMVRNRVSAERDDPAPSPLRRITSRRRPNWLEPSSDYGSWRASMWAAIEALYERYPKALGDLVDHWWENESCVETLCALATWRRSIDEAGHNPQEELEFQARLAECGEAFQRAATPGTRTWTPGRRPANWEGGKARMMGALDPTHRNPSAHPAPKGSPDSYSALPRSSELGAACQS
jgi:hypothetical protein